ncbi:MAG: glycosyltransferase family 4 protein [Actinomycetia bacterium]|nr:glycosyltransferase family 4 protein [Actinomycetes bacterium]
MGTGGERDGRACLVGTPGDPGGGPAPVGRGSADAGGERDAAAVAVLVIPDDTPEFGGNWVSAHRVARALALEGRRAEVVPAAAAPLAGPVLHAFNANTAVKLLERGADPGRLVVTWTGTDVWTDLVRDPARFAVLDPVPCQTVLEPGARRAILARYPAWADRVAVVPPGVDTRRFGPRGPREALAQPACLLVGGGRPVKRSLEAVDLVAAVREAGVPAELVVLGPPRDPAYWAALEAAAAVRPWLRTVPVVPFEAMPRWYRAAALVVNNSLVEGVSNALLEAMASGCAVLAHDIPGNRALVADGRTGVLFRDAAAFVAAAVRLLQDPAARQALGRRARASVRRRFDARREADRFLALYARARTAP